MALVGEQEEALPQMQLLIIPNKPGNGSWRAGAEQVNDAISHQLTSRQSIGPRFLFHCAASVDVKNVGCLRSVSVSVPQKVEDQ